MLIKTFGSFITKTSGSLFLYCKFIFPMPFCKCLRAGCPIVPSVILWIRNTQIIILYLWAQVFELNNRASGGILINLIYHNKLYVWSIGIHSGSYKGVHGDWYANLFFRQQNRRKEWKRVGNEKALFNTLIWFYSVSFTLGVDTFYNPVSYRVHVLRRKR